MMMMIFDHVFVASFLDEKNGGFEKIEIFTTNVADATSITITNKS